MSSAERIAEALHGLSTGNHVPPRPWAHLSHVGITAVSPPAWLQVQGFTDQAGFDVIADGQRYRITVSLVTDGG